MHESAPILAVPEAFGIRRSEIKEEAASRRRGTFAESDTERFWHPHKSQNGKGSQRLPPSNTNTPKTDQTVSNASTPVAVFEIGMW